MKENIELLFNKDSVYLCNFDINELAILYELYEKNKNNEEVTFDYLKKNFPLVPLYEVIKSLKQKRMIIDFGGRLILSPKGVIETNDMFYTKDEYLFDSFVEYVKLHELNLNLKTLNYELIRTFYNLANCTIIKGCKDTKDKSYFKNLIYEVASTLIRFAFKFNLNTKWGDSEFDLFLVSQIEKWDIRDETRGIYLLQRAVGEIGEAVYWYGIRDLYSKDELKEIILNGFRGLYDVANANGLLFYECLDPISTAFKERNIDER